MSNSNYYIYYLENLMNKMDAEEAEKLALICVKIDSEMLKWDASISLTD